MTTHRALPLVAALLLGSLSIAFAGEISTSTRNGKTVVEWNGKEVFRGKVDGAVQSKASDIDGKEQAAVVAENGEVLWESEPGAAAALKLIDPAKVVPAGAAADIKVKNSDGQSVVTFRGKEVWKGETDGPVSARAKEVDGKTYAAAFDGDKVLWENVRGAAKKVGKAPKGKRRAKGALDIF